MTRHLSASTKCSMSERRERLFSKNCSIGSLIFVAISSLGMFVVFWCTNIFRDTILSNLEIKEGSSMFERWQRPPVRPAYRVRIFNYTNIEDFQNGRAKKLKIRELGPYNYRETLTRVNPTINDDGSITYQEKRSFQWEGGSPDDEIVSVPNVPLISAMAFSRDMSFVAQVGITAFLTTLQPSTFIDVTAGGYLWGYDDQIFEVAKNFMSWQEEIPFEKFGLLAIKNGLSPDRITIDSGKADISETGRIKSINGESSLSVWGEAECDKIEGTDGTIFSSKALENHNSTLQVYARDMCRALPLEYRGQGMVRGVPTLTYKPPLDALTSTPTKDSCYCARDPSGSKGSPRVCPPAGIFNSSVCSMNMPFLVSFPHFYTGAEELLEMVEGLEPRAEDHESFVEIHPRLGVPIGGVSRFQINVEVRKAVGVPFLGKLKDGTILPLIWIEVGIDGMPEDLQNRFYHAYYTAAALEAGMKWLSIIGIVFCICRVMCILKRSRSERHKALKRNISGQNPLITIEKDP
ncbi:lysosome membrane protein 2-like [Venturia canescens]|uniref:lysosome membrane protein 2-like n=1 Tax=Venturia canescens TaxID=32260 RepID=UPI001C9BD293|nr:lysosome membrane protein 2-like [Venturia canescens]